MHLAKMCQISRSPSYNFFWIISRLRGSSLQLFKPRNDSDYGNKRLHLFSMKTDGRVLNRWDMQ